MGKIIVSFIPNVWIKCIHNQAVCIGRTYLHRGVKNTLQMVCLVSQNGHANHVLFAEVSDVSILRIATVCDFDIMYQNMESNELTKKLASLQLITSMS